MTADIGIFQYRDIIYISKHTALRRLEKILPYHVIGILKTANIIRTHLSTGLRYIRLRGAMFVPNSTDIMLTELHIAIQLRPPLCGIAIRTE